MKSGELHGFDTLLAAPVFDLNAIVVIAPACIVVLAEHISHLIVTGKITENDLMKKPGLHRSLLGDGIRNIVSGLVGSPSNTTYGEDIGVMAITRVYSLWVIHHSHRGDGRHHHVVVWGNCRSGFQNVCGTKS